MIQAPTPTFLSLWDMDDTSVVSADKTLKNAHLMLPIKLFQTRAHNQHLGILTNRSPMDEEEGHLLSVSDYCKMLQRFGISIPSDHIIFGGSGTEYSTQFNADYAKLIQAKTVIEGQLAAMAEIEAQLQSLKLTDGGTEVAALWRKVPLPTPPANNGITAAIEQLIKVKYHGKNFIINTFLTKRCNNEGTEYRFQSGTCLVEQMTVLMIDDKPEIVTPTSQLGSRFVGIKASEGGKAPKGKEDSKEFNEDDYLIEIAQRIGLDAYAKSLLENPKKHAKDDELLQLSALLYAWHVFPTQVNIEHFKRFEKCLPANERQQIAHMLAYIQAHPNAHFHSHYRSVDCLVSQFQSAEDEKNMDFLNTVVSQLRAIRSQVTALSRPASSVSESDLLASDPPKRGIGSFLKKTLSSRASANLPKKDDLQKHDQDEYVRLLQEEQTLKARLASLLDSGHEVIACQAKKIKETIEREGSFDFSGLYRTNVSSSSSTSSTNVSTSSVSASPPPPLEDDVSFRRKSYTPQSSAAAAPKPLFVANASTDSTSPLDLAPPPVLRGDSTKRGSTKKF